LSLYVFRLLSVEGGYNGVRLQARKTLYIAAVLSSICLLATSIRLRHDNNDPEASASSLWTGWALFGKLRPPTIMGYRRASHAHIIIHVLVLSVYCLLYVYSLLTVYLSRSKPTCIFVVRRCG
jgi:hypothetical protein